VQNIIKILPSNLFSSLNLININIYDCFKYEKKTDGV
jgi:hypothetical protein